jgi:hypothetical protein
MERILFREFSEKLETNLKTRDIISEASVFVSKIFDADEAQLISESVKNEYITEEELEESIDTLLTLKTIFRFVELMEEFSDEELNQAVQQLPNNKKFLEYYPIKVGEQVFYVDWDGENVFVTNPQDEKEKLDSSAFSVTELRDAVKNYLKSYTYEEPEDDEQLLQKAIDTETNKEKREKLSILQSIIRPNIIWRFANNVSDRTRLMLAIINHIKQNKDEKAVKQELDQRAIVDVFFDLLDVILSSRTLANMVARNAATAVLSESSTPKKKRPKNRKSVQDSITQKMDILLKLGLVSKDLYARTRKALTTSKKTAGSISMYRNLLLDLLGDILDYIKSDTTIYNRIRLKVMKEMSLKDYPTKKMLEQAFEEGCKAKRAGKRFRIPEQYKDNWVLRDQFERGYKSTIFGKPQEVETEIEEDVLNEVTPPDFPEDLKKKFLKQYKDRPQMAYATMWMIHKRKLAKKQREGQTNEKTSK